MNSKFKDKCVFYTKSTRTSDSKGRRLVEL